MLRKRKPTRSDEPFRPEVHRFSVRPALVPILLFAVLAVPTCAQPEGDFQPLFDGETLDGWHRQGGGSWAVKDGAIVGRHDASDPAYGQLVSDSVYRDFVAQLEFKVTRGDSGFYFRVADTSGRTGVKGFQAEVDTSAAVGGLYETGGRGWVIQPDPPPDSLARYVERHGWNRLTVRAVGDTITTWLNGHQIAHLAGNAGRREGHFALQLHGGQDMLVRYRNLEVNGRPVASGSREWE
jgi:hypothetical protein